jgi:hypothetical protein
MSINKFKPLMVSFDEDSFKVADKQAQEKLQLLDDASVWVHNAIPIEKKINLKRLHLNMLEYFRDAILVIYKDVNQLGLSADKLIEAKEINVSELIEIQKQYESIPITVVVNKDNLPTVEVKRKDYETWTTSESQNKRLLAGSKLISNLKDVEKYAQVYPRDINKATSGFINYNLQKQTYFVSPEFVFSDYKRTVV